MCACTQMYAAAYLLARTVIACLSLSRTLCHGASSARTTSRVHNAHEHGTNNIQAHFRAYHVDTHTH